MQCAPCGTEDVDLLTLATGHVRKLLGDMEDKGKQPLAKEGWRRVDDGHVVTIREPYVGLHAPVSDERGVDAAKEARQTADAGTDRKQVDIREDVVDLDVASADRLMSYEGIEVRRGSVHAVVAGRDIQVGDGDTALVDVHVFTGSREVTEASSDVA